LASSLVMRMPGLALITATVAIFRFVWSLERAIRQTSVRVTEHARAVVTTLKCVARFAL
jgi:hypothetical protein